MRCVAIDDEPLALKQLCAYISKVGYLELQASFTSSVEAQTYLKSNPTDLIFVDINMPDLSGIDLVRSLERRYLLIFTTAYAEYAVEGFRLDAIDYLLKPFSFKDFEKATLKANSLFELLQLSNSASQPEEATVPSEQIEMSADQNVVIDGMNMSVRADRKVSLVRIPNIIYIESEGEYIRIHLSDNTRITTLFRLKNIISILPSTMFIRIHRSYVVNMSFIKAYTKGKVYLSESEYLPVGEIYKDDFRQKMSERFGQ